MRHTISLPFFKVPNLPEMRLCHVEYLLVTTVLFLVLPDTSTGTLYKYETNVNAHNMHNIPGENATEIQSSMRKEVLMLKNFGDGNCLFKIQIYFEMQKSLTKSHLQQGKYFLRKR